MDCNGKTLDLSVPVVMGILNVTPDSFYEKSRFTDTESLLNKAAEMINEGAAIIDIGAVSTRPGSELVSEQEETDRLKPALNALVAAFPKIIISVDTFRSAVAEMALDNGAGIINDIYAGRYDEMILHLVAERNVPYVMMHMKGTPLDMQENPDYKDVVGDVIAFFEEVTAILPSWYKKVIIDPGFGFGKTVEHNFQLLKHLGEFKSFGFPVLAGLSRKSLVQRPLKIKSEESLNGTTVLNTIALLNGAAILRVHDVKEAIEAIRLVKHLAEAV